jgi:hypothetical protein
MDDILLCVVTPDGRERTKHDGLLDVDTLTRLHLSEAAKDVLNHLRILSDYHHKLQHRFRRDWKASQITDAVEELVDAKLVVGEIEVEEKGDVRLKLTMLPVEEWVDDRHFLRAIWMVAA